MRGLTTIFHMVIVSYYHNVKGRKMSFAEQVKKTPTEREYYLNRCKIKVIEKTFWHPNLKVQRTTRMVLLIPDYTNDQTAYFLSAWLPEDTLTDEEKRDGRVENEYYEIPVWFKHPLNTPGRCAIRRKCKDEPDYHHISVMDEGVEKELMNRIASGNDTIDVVVLGEQDEEQVL